MPDKLKTVLCLVVVLSFAGCSSSPKKPPQETNDIPPEPADIVETITPENDYPEECHPDDLIPRDSEARLRYHIRCDNTEEVLRMLQGGNAATLARQSIQVAGFSTTPLIMASQRGNMQVVEALLRLDANPNARDSFGENALDMAKAELRKIKSYGGEDSEQAETLRKVIQLLEAF